MVVNCLPNKQHTGQQKSHVTKEMRASMRSITICLVLGLTLNLVSAQQTTPESLAEVKPEIVFQDGSTFKYDTDFRTWSDASGNFSMSAKFDRFLSDGTVRLRREDNEKLINVKIEILAPDDRELLEKIRKQIDEIVSKREQIILAKREMASMAFLTDGWEEAVSQRRKYLSEMHEVYADDKLSEPQKQQRLLEINERFRKKPSVDIQVAMLVKTPASYVSITRVDQADLTCVMGRVLSGVEAANYPFLRKRNFTEQFRERYFWRSIDVDVDLQEFTKQVDMRNRISVGDIVLVPVRLHAVSVLGDGVRGINNWSCIEVAANPSGGLAKFEKLDLGSRKQQAEFPDLAMWQFHFPPFSAAKRLRTKHRELLTKLDAYFAMLTEKYGLEVYAKD